MIWQGLWCDATGVEGGAEEIGALDIERRRAWNQAAGRRVPASTGRRGRTVGDSRKIARSRYAL